VGVYYGYALSTKDGAETVKRRFGEEREKIICLVATHKQVIGSGLRMLSCVRSFLG